MNKHKLIIFALLIIVSSIAVLFLPLKEWGIAMQFWIRSLGWFGPFVFILIYVVTTVLLIPGSVLTLAAGAIFGVWIGSAAVLIGSNLGAFVSFLLARTKLRAKVAAWAAASPRFTALDRAIGLNGFKMVLLTRLSPAFPFTLLNYFLGLTSVETGAYLGGTLLGMLPATFLYVYIGALLGASVTGQLTGNASTFQLVLKIVGLLATVAVVIFVTRIARKAMRASEIELDDEQKQPS